MLAEGIERTVDVTFRCGALTGTARVWAGELTDEVIECDLGRADIASDITLTESVVTAAKRMASVRIRCDAVRMQDCIPALLHSIQDEAPPLLVLVGDEWGDRRGIEGSPRSIEIEHPYMGFDLPADPDQWPKSGVIELVIQMQPPITVVECW